MTDNGRVITDMAEEEWAPKTRQDWLELYADGMGLHQSRVEEAAAKAKQQETDADKDKDKTPPPKRSLADRILGNPATSDG